MTLSDRTDSAIRSVLLRGLTATAVALGAVGILGALTPLSAAQALPAGVRSDVEDFTFSSFDGEYTIGRDDNGNSTLTAVETFVAEFPEFDQNKGIIRAIPEGYLGVNLHTEVTSVTDADGNAVEFDDSETEDGFIQLALGNDDYVRGTQTYVIEYTQRDAVRAFSDTDADEFYWDAPGTGWDQPFAEAQMRVIVPEELAGELTGAAACYSGPQGSTNQCELEETADGGAVEFATSAAPLSPHETFTVAIAFEPGTFVTPEIPSTWPVFTVVPATLTGLGVIGLVAALIARRRNVRDAPGRSIIVPQYSVPRGLDIVIAADLIDATARAIPALLLSLAVRGNIRIIDHGESSKFLAAKRKYSVQFLTDDGASAADIDALDALFGSSRQTSQITELEAKDVTLGTKLRALTTGAKDAAVRSGYRVKRTVPGAARFAVFAIAVFLILLLLLFAGLQLYGTNIWLSLGLFIGAPVVFVTLFAVSSKKVLTLQGAEARDYLLGLKEYLELAERDRIAMLQSPSGAERVAIEDRANPGNILEMVKFYEKLLPFAVLWGIEKDWADELGRYYATAGTDPDWYSSRSGFSPSVFSAGLHGFASTSGASTPWSGSGAASSSGGSGGGGFSGGGGGGGGGGGR